MEQKSILVIGAGVAGLSAGCYGRMNGYRVRLLEQDSKPGGLCTSWERNGYTIHGNMAFLAGSGPGVGFHRIWQELGVVPAMRMIEYEYFIVFQEEDGRAFYVYSDIDKLEKHMKELAPADACVIDDFIGGVRVLARYDLPIDKAPELLSLADKLRFVLTRLPLLRAMNKWKKIAIEDFAARFKTPLLRRAFSELKLAFSAELPTLLILFSLAWSHRKSLGYPIGGGLAFARAIEHRFLELGGEVHYGSRVCRILVEKDRAVGVRTEDGREYFADYVISAADGRSTIFRLLEGRYADAAIRRNYDSLPVAQPVLLVSLGVSRSFNDLPRSATGWVRFLDKPVIIGGREFRSIRVMILHFDPTLAPPGKTLVRLVLPVDYEYWNALRSDPERYRLAKDQVGGTVVSLLDRIYPGLASQVEMWDVATPLTFERYTGNWKGSLIGWACTTRTFFMPMRKTLPGLAHFYMAGQWVEPGGGIASAAASGRNVIQLMRRD